MEVLCPYCGGNNAVEAIRCGRCGKDLPPHAFGGHKALNQKVGVKRTVAGIILMAITSFLFWLPILLGISLILGAIGAILIIYNRNVFGGYHNVYPIVSALMFISAIFAELFLGSLLGDVLPEYGSNTKGALSAMLPIAIGILAVQLIVSISFAIILYALMARTGKILTWCGLIVSVGIFLWLSYVVDTLLEGGIRALSHNQTAGISVTTIAARLNGYDFRIDILLLIPSAFYIAAYATVYDRIRNGEIPAGFEGKLRTW